MLPCRGSFSSMKRTIVHFRIWKLQLLLPPHQSSSLRSADSFPTGGEKPGLACLSRLSALKWLEVLPEHPAFAPAKRVEKVAFRPSGEMTDEGANTGCVAISSIR